MLKMQEIINENFELLSTYQSLTLKVVSNETYFYWVIDLIYASILSCIHLDFSWYSYFYLKYVIIKMVCLIKLR